MWLDRGGVSFFLLSLLSIRVFYPALARRFPLDEGDAEELQSLSRQMGFFLYVAGRVPSLGMLALLTFSLSTQTQNTFALWVLSIMGALGFALALLIYRTLQRDLSALIVAASPSEKL